MIRSLRTMSDPVVLDKFRGAMIGAIVGDCLGSPLEFITEKNLPFRRIEQQFEIYAEENKKGKWHYTDDTAMARELASSLIEKKSFSAKDLADRFQKQYHAEPGRGYGNGVVDVFLELRKQKCTDPFGPAKLQFGGSGSYGNGGAMRVHPVALFGFQDKDSVLDIAKKSAQITHSHSEGVNGAILQAYAVYLALHNTKRDDFVKEMKDLAESLEKGTEIREQFSWVETWKNLEDCLKSKDDKSAYTQLGNGVQAIRSVPAACYSFLRVLEDDIEDIKSKDKFIQTLQLAYSFGGDTDTIGSMAGAIAGAYYRLKAIPFEYWNICEGIDDAFDHADKFYARIYGQNTNKEKPKLT